MLNRIAAVGWEKEDLGYVGIAFGKACPKCPQGRKDPSDRRFVVHCVLVLAHTPTLDRSEMWGCDADMTKMVARKGDAHLPYIHGSLVFRASLSTFFSSCKKSLATSKRARFGAAVCTQRLGRHTVFLHLSTSLSLQISIGIFWAACF